MRKLFVIISFALFSTLLGQNGIIKGNYSDGTPSYAISYINDLLDGTSFWYYPNGNLKYEKNYTKGVLDGWVREYYESGILKEEYFTKFGVIEGTNKRYYENGVLKSIIYYSEGVITKSDYFEPDKNFVAPAELYQGGNRQLEIAKKKSKELICDAEICPIPIGGLKTIQEKLVYPEHALLYGLEGTVTLIAEIDENGDVASTNVIIPLGLGCDEAAKEAVMKTKFIPGQTNGKSVRSNLTINLAFQIEQSKKVNKINRE
ncbi:MAG: TonB family protein [Ignavibacteriaceae bacterium]|jgi:TonB family protein|nr:TonB family protein [Ignavibacteriaceae bacterium]